MSWNSIIGQQRVKNILQRAILENRIAHAYCFWGQEGVGKEALAIEFAKVVNCQKPIIKNNSIEKCGKCKSCINANKLQHQKIDLIYPLPPGESTNTEKDSPLEAMSDAQISEIREQVELKSANPYHKINLKKANQIKILSIRALKKKLIMSSGQDGRQFVLVFDADKMTNEASNAFLKQLEEPHDGITIIMVTSRYELILPTILSRCQKLHCPSISDEELAQALIQIHQVSEVDARMITNFAQGSYTRALQFMDERFTGLRREIVEVLRCTLKKREYRVELLEKTEQLAKDNDKNSLEIILQMFIIWLRDARSVELTNSDSFIINIDQFDTINRFVKNFGKKDIPSAINSIEKAILRLRRNVQPKIVLLALFIEFRQIFLEEV